MKWQAWTGEKRSLEARFACQMTLDSTPTFILSGTYTNIHQGTHGGVSSQRQYLTEE